MGKEEAILSVLAEIRDLLRGLRPAVEVSAGDEAVAAVLTREHRSLEQLKYAPDRMLKRSDGSFLDLYLLVYFRAPFFWSPVGSEEHSNWGEAEKYAKFFGRQPSRFELESLIDPTKSNPALVPGALVLGLKLDDCYWTNEGVAGNPDFARLVNLKHGGVNNFGKGYSMYVRPVRLSQ